MAFLAGPQAHQSLADQPTVLSSAAGSACGTVALQDAIRISEAVWPAALASGKGHIKMQPVRPAGQAGAPVGAVQMPFSMLQNINTLSELSGIPVAMLSNPAMQLAAQQMVAQRLMQQQMLASGQMRPGAMLPAQVLALQQAQQAQLQQRLAAVGSATPAAKKAAAGGRKRGRGAAAAAAAAPAAAAFAAAPVRPTNPYADPGGRVVWAKVGSYPWWPAKTLDAQRDMSFPPDADPPRPTSIPIRFFGTFEFQWIGSKRALVDWDEGFEQYSRECDQSSFRAAIEEVQQYKAIGKLPDVFYVTPEPEKPKGKARGRKRGRPAADPAELMAAAAAGGLAAAGLAGKPRSAGRAAEQVEDRSLVVQQRRKQRLQELGLLPPDNSPYIGGRVAPNPHLLQFEQQWRQQYSSVIEEHTQQQAALAERKAAAAAAAQEKAAALAQARQAEAAAAAAAHAVPGHMQQQAALAGVQPSVLPLGLLQMQQMMAMQAGGGLPMMQHPSG